MKAHTSTLDRLRLRHARRKAALTKAGKLTAGVAWSPPADDADKLPPPFIYNLIGGGLNRDKLLGDFSTVQVRVGPWDFPTIGDTILLHWGELWTQQFPGSTEPGGTILTLAGVDIAGEPLADHDHFKGEGTHKIWYELVPANGGSATSDTMSVIVKTARPGGEDPRPDTPVNENLDPPTATPDPVDEAATQCVFTAKPWKNREADDTLAFRIGGYVYPAPSGSLTVTLSKDELAAVAGKATPVTYEIVDSVGNRSKNAPYLLLDIWSEGSDLLERIELVDDHGEFIQGAIDSTMTDIRARVPRYQSPPVPEGVWVKFDGTDRDGNGDQFKLLGPIIWKPTDYYLDFDVPNDYLQTIAGGFVRVYYYIDGELKKSYRRVYDVDALPETRLPAPQPLGEIDNELPIGTDPTKEIGIRIPDSEWLIEFSRITLSMRGQGASGPVLKESVHNVGEGEGHTPYTFRWTAADLEPLVDHEATFSYTIRTQDAGGSLSGIHESEEHTVLVRNTRSPGERLPPPVVHGLVDGNLDPKTDPLQVTIPAGHGKPLRTKVTTTVSGLTVATHTDVLFDDNEAVDVDFSGWTALNDGSVATAWYTFEGDMASKEASFTVGEARSLPPPSVDEATGNELDPVNARSGATVRVPASADVGPSDSVTATFGSYTTTPQQGSANRIFTIPYAEVEKAAGSTIQVHYTVNRTQNSRPLTLTVKELSDEPSHGVAYQVEDFELLNDLIMPGTPPTQFRHFSVEAIGEATMGAYVPDEDAPYLVGTGLTQMYDTSCQTKITLNEPTHRLRFGLGPYGKVTVYAGDGKVLMNRTYTKPGWVDFDDPDGAMASYIVVAHERRAGYLRYIDNVMTGTGETWQAKAAPFTETFDDLPLGNQGTDATLPRWRIRSPGNLISVVEAPAGMTGRTIRIQLVKNPNLYELIPRFAIRPRSGVTLKIRSGKLPGYNVDVYLAYIDSETLQQRVVGKSVTIRPTATTVTFDGASTTEYVAYLAVKTLHSDDNESIYYDDIQFL